MGILAKKLTEWTPEMLIEQFLHMNDKKLCWCPGSKDSRFPQVKKAIAFLEGKNLVRKTAENELFVVYQYIGPETTQSS